MKEQLAVTIIQSDLIWENPQLNRLHFSEKIEKIEGPTDLIILPEMWTTGFTMQAKELAEEHEGETLQWMKTIAKRRQVAVTGSVIIKANNKYYNRLFFVYPSGEYAYYDKRHTFTLAGEHKTYTSGTQKLIVTYKGFKICPLICYDLRFPVWARNVEQYDVLIYVANWPKRRILAWDTLLQARAIENMSYCIGVNRMGKDGNNYEYVGHSVVFDVLGKQISTSNLEEEFVETIILEKEHISSNRDQLQFLNDRDAFNLG